MSAPDLTSLPPVYAELARSRNTAADAALVEGLAHMEAAYQPLALGVLLHRDHDPALGQVVALYSKAEPSLRLLLSDHVEQLAGGTRVCIAHSLYESRRSAVEFIRDSRHGKSAYLLSEAIAKPCRHTASLAAEALLSLAGHAVKDCRPWASSSKRQPFGQLEHVASAVERALGSWPLHFRNEVVQAAVLLAGPLEDVIIRMAEDSRSHIARALNNTVAGAQDPRLVGYCLRALRCTPIRDAALKCLAGMSSKESEMALLDHGWLLADPELRRVCAWLKSAPGLHNSVSDWMVVKPRRARSRVRLVQSSGYKPAEKATLLGTLSLDSDPASMRAAFWSLMDSAHEESNGLLQVIASRGGGEEASLAAMELRRRKGRRLKPDSEQDCTPPNRGQSPRGGADVFEPFWVEYEALDVAGRRDLAFTVASGIPEFDDYLRSKWIAGDTGERGRVLSIAEDTGRTDTFIEEIYDAAHADEAVLRSQAIRLLGGFEDARSIRLVRAALDDPDVRVQANAVESMAEANHQDAAAQIRQKLTSENSRVRANAVKALLEMRVRDGAVALLEMLTSPSGGHRTSALWVVEHLHLAQLMGRMIAIADGDPDPRVKRRAMRIAEKFQESLQAESEARDDSKTKEVTA